MFDIWFWQRTLSPHMVYLAEALVSLGCKVTYVAECALTVDRMNQGWSVPAIKSLNLVYADNKLSIHELVQKAAPGSIHICQGIRGNGIVSVAQQVLSSCDFSQWVVMETVDDSGWRGCLKRLEYSRLFAMQRNKLMGILAIGQQTPTWISARGMNAERVYPFAYFLPYSRLIKLYISRKPGPFRFVFVGRLIRLKRLDWLLKALINLSNHSFELLVVGSGAEELSLRKLAEPELAGRVRWLGQLPIHEIPGVIAEADCLVLPSIHDGWGAVVSEALMVGTPVVCSDACGAAGVVSASGLGGVFFRDRFDVLQKILHEQLLLGPISPEGRLHLAKWAASLGVEAGANYLISILDHVVNGKPRPIQPWGIESNLD